MEREYRLEGQVYVRKTRKVGPEVGENFLRCMTWGVPFEEGPRIFKGFYKFGWDFIEDAYSVGEEIEEESFRNKRKQKWARIDRRTSIESHKKGAFGEAAFCFLVGVPWPRRMGTFEMADVGGRIEVKATAIPFGPLRIELTDPLEREFVLVELAQPYAKVVGWYPGSKVRGHRITDPGKKKSPCWEIPQEELEWRETMPTIKTTR